MIGKNNRVYDVLTTDKPSTYVQTELQPSGCSFFVNTRVLKNNKTRFQEFFIFNLFFADSVV